MKTVDTSAYLNEVVSLLKEGYQTSIPIRGTSMLPFLKENRDSVFLEYANEQTDLKVGDILLFIRWDERYVLHRVHKIDSNGLLMLGDNQLRTEPIDRNQIKARVISVKRKGKLISQKNRVWKFYSGPWNRILLLRKVAGLVSRLKIKWRPDDI